MYAALMGIGLATWIAAFIAPYIAYRKLDGFTNSTRFSTAIALFLFLFITGPLIFSYAADVHDENRLTHTEFESIAELRAADRAGVETRAELLGHRKKREEQERLEQELKEATKARVEAEKNLQKPEDYSQWNVRRSTNLLDDSQTVVISVNAVPLPSGRSSGVAFVARCQSNKTEAYIQWNRFTGDDSPTYQGNWKNVAIRLGEEKAETQRWTNSTDKQGTFAPGWAGNLLNRMSGHTSMLAQMTPHLEQPMTVLFPIAGMEGPLKELREACNW